MPWNFPSDSVCMCVCVCLPWLSYDGKATALIARAPWSTIAFHRHRS